MEISNEKARQYINRLLLARMRILCNHGFYGLLLMHMIYSIDEGVKLPIPMVSELRLARLFLKNCPIKSWIL